LALPAVTAGDGARRGANRSAHLAYRRGACLHYGFGGEASGVNQAGRR